MNREELARRLMATFLDELDERVGDFNRQLVALEKEGEDAARREIFQELFRTAHSLKGASRSVGLTPIEHVSHALEELLSSARDGERPLGREEFKDLFAAADAFEDAGKRLRDGRPLTDGPLTAALASLVQIRRGTSRPAKRGIPRAPPPPPSSPSEKASGLPAPRAPFPPPAAGRAGASWTPSWSAPDPLLAVAPAPTPSRPQPLAPSAVRPEKPPFVVPRSEPSPVPPAPGPLGKAVSPPPAPLAPVHAREASVSLRVRAERLDALLAEAGELRVACGRLEKERDAVAALHDHASHLRSEAEARVSARVRTDEPTPLAVTKAVLGMQRLEAELDRVSVSLEREVRFVTLLAGLLDEDVRRLRMVPFEEACAPLERAVRDLCASTGKSVTLVVEGADVMLDRHIVQRLGDPLLHLVRNAVDHGIEAPEVRRAAGKPSSGRVVVSATLRGGLVDVVVKDDGRGLDLKAIRARGVTAGLSVPADEQQLARLVFQPGFSTASKVTEVSGRGVGLDVVRDAVVGLHGTVNVGFEPGNGAALTLVLPVTLTTLRAVLARVGDSTFVVATVAIRRLLRVRASEVFRAEGAERIASGDRSLPLVSLATLLGLPSPPPLAADAPITVLVLEAEGREVAFAVDEFESETLVMVKGLGGRLRRVRHVSGATLLPSGEVGLILNAAELVRSALRGGTSPRLREGLMPARASATKVKKRRLLVVDDSVTTRMLEKMILESAGYEVTVAPDGAEAWRSIQEAPPDLVVSDVEMPRMDGIALTETIRSSSRFQGLPVVLVTGLAREEDRRRGLESGASAYVVKSAFDQKVLLETIARLL